MSEPDDKTASPPLSPEYDETAPVAFPPASSARHREYLLRRATDGLHVAAVCLAHLLDAAERGVTSGGEARPRRGAIAPLRRAAALATAAAEELGADIRPARRR